MDPTPQRLQTALGLYSNDLCGLVLLSDNHLGSYSGITKGIFQNVINRTSTVLKNFLRCQQHIFAMLKYYIVAELCSICQLTTEFHFPPIDEQLEKIKEDVKDAVAWRQAHYREGSDPHVGDIVKNLT